MKRIAILGSTGSIGTSALDVVASHPERLQVVGLAAGANVPRLAEQAARFRPRLVAVRTPEAAAEARQLLHQARLDVEIAPAGGEGLIAVATHPEVEIVLCASAGTAALEAVLAAIEAGKTIALANKEVLVMAGAIMIEAAQRHGVSILPVDSEHNAVHQCLHGRDAAEVRRVILTASGGPFRTWSLGRLEQARPDDALRHPTWRMGPKITIDSATLMNKGLEVIEARWLFGLTAERIDVVIHPESVVHSLVELRDGSVMAQLGITDMRLPIQYAFSYPDRWDGGLPALDLTRYGRLEFQAPDRQRFPCLDLAYQALRGDSSLPIVLNAANEVAVGGFLAGALGFGHIAPLIEQTLGDAPRGQAVATLDDVRGVDRWARRHASELVRRLQLKV